MESSQVLSLESSNPLKSFLLKSSSLSSNKTETWTCPTCNEIVSEEKMENHLFFHPYTCSGRSSESFGGDSFSIDKNYSETASLLGSLLLKGREDGVISSTSKSF